MFKNKTERLLDILIEEARRKFVESEKYDESLLQTWELLNTIRRLEDRDLMDREFKAWFKGFGTAIAAIGVGSIIGTIWNKLV